MKKQIPRYQNDHTTRKSDFTCHDQPQLSLYISDNTLYLILIWENKYNLNSRYLSKRMYYTSNKLLMVCVLSMYAITDNSENSAECHNNRDIYW
jgi:hypothetical protein